MLHLFQILYYVYIPDNRSYPHPIVRFITDSNDAAAGFSAIYSADCPPLEAGAGAIASSRDTTFGSVVQFTCPLGQLLATGVTEIRTEVSLNKNKPKYIRSAKKYFKAAKDELNKV